MQSSEQPTFFLNADIILIEGDVPTPAATDDGSSRTIGDLTAEFGITPRALRFYETRGLVAPTRIAGVRTYDQSDRERIALILKAKKFGFTLVEIKEMIEAQQGCTAAQSLKLSRQKCIEQIELLERRREEVEDALTELRRIHAMLANPAAAR